VAAYRAGESRYLSREEYEIHKRVNEQFRDSDIWLSAIENWLIDQEIQRFSIERILLECLGFTLDKIDTKSRNRIRDCLISLGCTPLGSRRESEYDGKARRVWQSPEKFPSQVVIDEPDNGDNGDNGSDNGSVVVQNPDTARVTTVTTLDNGKKANFFQSQNNGKIPDPDPVEEAEESYEAGLIREIGLIFDRLQWDKYRIDHFLFTRYDESHLEFLSRSDLIDAADLLIKIEEKSNGKNNYSLENNKRNC
jgi:hypothetical protein